MIFDPSPTPGVDKYGAGSSASGIYQVKCSVSGKSYIGSAKNLAARWALHLFQLRNNKHHSKALQRSWNKYGHEYFDFSVLEMVTDLNQLVSREQFWMDRIKPEYNCRPIAHSQLGFRHSAESIEKCRIASTGRKWSESQRAKFVSKMRGRIVPKDVGEKIRKALLGRKLSPEHVAKVSAFHKGRKWPEHAKENLRRVRRDKREKGIIDPPFFHSEESKLKMSLAKKGRKKTPEQLEAIRLGKERARIMMIAKFLMVVKPSEEQLAQYCAA